MLKNKTFNIIMTIFMVLVCGYTLWIRAFFPPESDEFMMKLPTFAQWMFRLWWIGYMVTIASSVLANYGEFVLENRMVRRIFSEIYVYSFVATAFYSIIMAVIVLKYYNI